MLVAHLSAPLARAWQRVGRTQLDGTIALECSTRARPSAGGGHAAATDGARAAGSNVRQ
jgi:hypothetical protein